MVQNWTESSCSVAETSGEEEPLRVLENDLNIELKPKKLLPAPAALTAETEQAAEVAEDDDDDKKAITGAAGMGTADLAGTN
jgi:hypothetical protein